MRIRNAQRDDLSQLVELCNAHDQCVHGKPETTEDDVSGILAAAEGDAWVCVDDEDRVVGFAAVTGSLPLFPSMVIAEPAMRGNGIEAQLFEEMEASVRRRVSEKSNTADSADSSIGFVESGTICVSSFDAYEDAFFSSRGFEAKRHWFRMGIELESAPTADWPQEFTSRPYQPGADDLALHAAFEESFADHWGTAPGTLEKFLERTKRPQFRQDMWHLACAGDEIAGFLFREESVEGAGEVYLLGVRPAWRKQGLGRHLLRFAFAKFWEEGRPRVELSVDSDSLTGATRLYQAMGMRALNRFTRYDKEVN